jgi:DNA-binding IclR family transcriptional regulator
MEKRMETEDDRYRAPALDKGLDILELLAEIDGGLTQAEIAKRLGRSPNEFYRMLDRLVRRGYVTRLDGDRYSLTLKLFGLAQLHVPVRRLVSYATPFMRELAEETRQANQLAVFDRGSVVVVAQQEAPGYWGISIRVGSHISLYDTGSGHVLLAFRSPDERQMMINEYSASGEQPTAGKRVLRASRPDPGARLRGHAERPDRRRLQPFRPGAWPRRPRHRGADHPLYQPRQCAASTLT